ncbi:C2 domain-containing protein 2 isoform X2 [Malaclemys terrapin pileata]|uniref:C2 domain-containing protein 2 isoform X2 n=1 Tax=Malaclemys terrapin pileata TaxID=2991368 RepID=UPI0023A7DBFC|nr:C2 domain-containing protein 2 isoform X2 [Malaclemys terrapin pileata]
MAWPAYWVDEIQWFTLVTLFVAALVTLAIYLVQYALVALRNSRRKPPSSDELLQGNDTLLAWVLSLNSWRTQWQKAWITALNAEAKVRGDLLLLTFEEDTTPQPLELAVRRVVSVVKSAQEKVVSCNVVGDSIQFIVHVSHTSPTTTECQSYSVKLSPLHLQLELYLKEKGEDIEVVWSFLNAPETNIKIQPTAVQEGQMAETCAIFEPFRDVFQNLISLVSPSVILSTKPTDIIKEVQNVQNIGTLPQGTSPPKPPRIHELKLLVKNIVATLTDHSAAGSINPVCVTQLNDPLQKFSSSVAKNGTNLSWKEEFIFELNAKSKELQLQILEDGKLDTWTTIPLDLFRKQPSGQQSFALKSRSSSHSPVLGSVTAEFSYVEPNESKSWQVSAQLPATKIEKDRTVMPCGTVVTTVTAVKTKPRLEGKHSALSPDSPVKTPAKVKVIEKDFSVQAIHCQGAPVSKVLSSSDTELLVLNGTDPVAEAAIRQLSESAKQKLKSPRKKSTIIISGVSKTSLSQDSEAALMMDYAAAMDDSCKEEAPSMVGDSTTEVPNKKLPPAASQMLPATDPEENSHNAWDLDNSSQQWTSNALLDQDCEEVSGSSLSVSESESVKKSKGGILKKSAKLFFRRRHHQKDPGMSQSHNDLVYLQQPTSDETRRKGTTLTRILHKKILSKNKSKNKLNGTSMEPCV